MINQTSSALNIKPKYACSHLSIGLGIVIGQISIILFPIIFSSYFPFKNNLSFVFFAVFFICLSGTRMRALGNIIHECSHFNFVKSRRNNYYIGKILSIVEFSCFDKYLKDHYSHHKYLGDLKYDEDFKSRQFIGICKKQKISLKSIILIVFSVRNWFFILKTSFTINCKDRLTNIIRVIYILTLIILSFVFGFKLIFLFIILPYMTSYQLFKIFSDYLDHGGLYHHHKKEYKTRNHYFSLALLNWLFFPRNDCYHLIHHLYPTVPTNYLPEIHIFLLNSNSEYAKRRHKIF